VNEIEVESRNTSLDFQGRYAALVDQFSNNFIGIVAEELSSVVFQVGISELQQSGQLLDIGAEAGIVVVPRAELLELPCVGAQFLTMRVVGWFLLIKRLKCCLPLEL